ncbi:MAG: hypothetical protein ACTHJ8_20365 [Mucilaginibacter sp.]
MSTIELNPSVNLATEEVAPVRYSAYKRFLKYAETQTEKRAVWFLLSILGPGVLFLPLPAFLMYYYDAPIWTLATTLVLFFASVVTGMAGSKTSVVIFLLGLSIAVHLGMIAAFVL